MHGTQEQPSRSGFWGERTGWRLLKQVLFLEPLPGGSRWAAAFGSLLLFAFALQVVTGVLLMMNYAPSVETAWSSVRFIQEDVPLGAFIRALHHWGSSAMVILLLAHLLQVFVWGAYKKPRELTWMVGVLLLFCTLGLAFTGYLLPWDQKAYWATKVGVGIASTVPVVGDGLRALLQGGPQLGNLTLTRFFTMHTILLPGLLVLLVVVHLYLFRLHGVTPPWWETAEQLRAEEEPFWPKQVLKDAVVWLVFLVGLGLWCSSRPAPLEEQADPSQPYEARPEWYFMFLFQLLRYFHGPWEVVGTFVLPLVFFLILFFWPLLDRSPYRDPRRRPVAMGLLGLGTAGLVGLTIFAVVTDVRMTEPAQATAKTSSPAAEPAGPIQRADVARVYNTSCAGCHGIDGSARQTRLAMPTIPDFTSLAWQMSQTNLAITHRIEEGSGPQMPAYRDQLAQTQILALTLYVRVFAFATAEPSPPKLGPKPPALADSGMPPAQVYKSYCLGCHDADGGGRSVRKGMPKIPDFTDAKWQDGHSDAEVKQAILEGKKPLMQPLKDRLAPADAVRLVAYVRAFRGGKKVVDVSPEKPPVRPTSPKPEVIPDKRPPERPPTAEAAARLRVATGFYQQYCLACHGTDGRGSELKTSMPALPDFTSRAWQEEVSTPQLTVGILDGKGTLMPAFRGRVSEEQARDLAAYVRAFGPARAAPAEAPASDFEKRFRDLQDEWNELQRQLRELSRPPRKP